MCSWEAALPPPQFWNCSTPLHLKLGKHNIFPLIHCCRYHIFWSFHSLASRRSPSPSESMSSAAMCLPSDAWSRVQHSSEEFVCARDDKGNLNSSANGQNDQIWNFSFKRQVLLGSFWISMHFDHFCNYLSYIVQWLIVLYKIIITLSLPTLLAPNRKCSKQKTPEHVNKKVQPNI